MRLHGWSVARAAAASAIAGLLFAALLPSTAGAASSTPTLTVSVTRVGDVKVAWKFTTDEPRDDVQLRLERKVAGQNQFTELKTLSRPRASSSYTDHDDIAGSRSYQARLVIRGTAGQPGNVASLAAPSTGATTTTTTTTTQPSDPNAPALKPGESECTSGYVAEVLRLVNEERKKNGAAPLQNNDKLANAARQRSIDMGITHDTHHTGWVDTINEYGYRWSGIAENIAWGYPSPAAVVDGWIKSSGHHTNMLGNYKDSGVGCVVGNDGRRWWTQDFGR